MHFFSLSTVALTLLTAINTVQANQPLSWDQAYIKAQTLVGNMSLEQKVNITTGVGWMNGLCVGNTPAISNPNFPGLCLQDSPLGMRFANNVTVGVAGINAAASFDKAQIYARGVYMGQEYRGKGVNVQLGPGMNFMRSPEGGRGWESGGEDPFLTGVVAAETIQGIQSQGVIATAKHYILNDQELNRTNESSVADSRTLHEIYLWPFARSVEAGVGSVMCSYNKVNGTYACEDDYLLNTVLKGELGFRGFIQSDWSATMSTVPSANAGLDMTMPGDITFGSGDSYFGKNLTNAVNAGEVSEERTTDMATRIVAAWYKMGQDNNFPKTVISSFHVEQAPYVNVQANHSQLVRALGAASTILLKNENNVLPISPKTTKSIAIIGSDAAVNPAGINACSDHGCDQGTLAQGWGSGTASFPYLVDPLTGLTKAFGKLVKVQKSLSDWDLNSAANAATSADYAFVFSTADSGEQYITVDGNEGDRNNLSLWNNGDNLIKAVADANNNTIVVIHSVGAVLMPWIDHPNIKAILWPGLQGQELGNTLADIVTGVVNPSARLPYTIAKNASDYNARPDPSDSVEYSEQLLMGYKWFDHANIEPLFPFGHGLSYTTFNYTQFQLQAMPASQNRTTTVNATVSVKNAGLVDGAEVVQAYLAFPDSAGEPPKLLRGFEKVFIKTGSQAKVSFNLTKTELSIWDAESASWVIPTGNFTLHVGASSRDIRASADFTF